MTTIKNIIFDFGGVLVDWNPRYFYRSYFNDDEEMEYFLSNICTTEWNAEHDRGVSFAENISQLQAKHPEWSEAIGMFRTGWESMMRSYIPESVELLKKLKAQGFHLYGLTNWSQQNAYSLTTTNSMSPQPTHSAYTAYISPERYLSKPVFVQ